MGKGKGIQKGQRATKKKVQKNKEHRGGEGTVPAAASPSAQLPGPTSAQRGMAEILDAAIKGNDKEQSVESADDSESEFDSDEDTEVALQSETIGEEDTQEGTPAVCAKATETSSFSVSLVPETKEDASSQLQQPLNPPKKASFASLFVGNKQRQEGARLDKVEVGEGPIKLTNEDVDPSIKKWGHCLVGYFGGKFPGKQALHQIVSSWNIEVNVHFHSSGWIIFRFQSEDVMTRVLQEGPYMIFGRPLLLKTMPKYFAFDNEELSCFPVWVQFTNLPLSLWSTNVIQKMCSKLGNPICVDKYTANMERISYARALVEINVANEVIRHIHIELPNGELLEQAVHYENLPKFCTHCKVMGHSTKACKMIEKSKGKGDASSNQAAPNSGRVVSNDANPKQLQTLVPPAKGNRFQALATKDHEAEKSGTMKEVQQQEQAHNTTLQQLGEQQQQEQTKSTKEMQQQEQAHNTALQQQKQKKSIQAEGTAVEQHPNSTSRIGQNSQSEQQQHNKNKSVQDIPPGQDKAGIVGKKGKKHKGRNEKTTDAFTDFCAGMGHDPPLAFQNMIVSVWNIRGFNKPLKHKGVLDHLKKHNVDVMGILETKLKKKENRDFIKKKFSKWNCLDNFNDHHSGRILILWNPAKVKLELVESHAQVVHCESTCLVTGNKVYMSFIYGYNTIAGRRPLWENLVNFSLNGVSPWIVLGDFNNVLNCSERVNGMPVTDYQIKDFVQCCNITGLVDTKFQGSFLTWTNNTTWCKLDRVMVNYSWLMQGHNVLANFGLPSFISDHAPVVAHLFEDTQLGPRFFKFFNMWTEHEEFLGTVQQAWEMNVWGTKMYKLCRKLKALKVPLKALNKKHFAHISERAVAAENELISVQQKLHDCPTDTDLQEKMIDMKGRAYKLAEANRSYCTQLAKTKYIQNSDRNSKFFHDIVKNSMTKNHIASVTLADGSKTTSATQVSEAFVQFYKDLLGTDLPCDRLNTDTVRMGKTLREEQAADLIKPVTDAEIKNSLFSIGNEKSPGPDGFTSCFFKKAWRIVGEDFSAAIKEFFHTGQILRQINHTALALIPKTKGAAKVENFRPIACCNVTYKVISKIISARLAGTLQAIIDPAQAAFIKGRSMAENIFLLQEMLRHYGRKRSSPRCILNVDLRKAFDSVEWAFLLDLLEALKFPSTFVNWIKACITTTSYSVVFNGSMHGFFEGKRGLRQGDPLSPFLFVLCLDYLSRGLSRLQQNADFNFHPKCGALKITHLAFADDLILLSRGDPTSVSLLKDNLDHFGQCSGLRSSMNKSSIISAGICVQDLNAISATTGFNQGSFPFRYLGIPVADKRLSLGQYSPFIDNIAGYISSWAGATLSYAGRLELINSVLQGVECFWLSILPIPAGVTAKVIQLCRNFLWGGQCRIHKKPLVAWKEATLPKEEGGLGIRSLKAWNKALLTRTLWDIQAKKDSLWVQWVHHFYMKSKTLWAYKSKHEDSPLIKQITALKEELTAAEGSVEAAQHKLEQWTDQGTLLTRKAYEHFRPREHPLKWPKLVWCSGCLPKQSFILWLGIKGKLLTRDKLQDQISNQQCSLCHTDIESVDHLFFQCPFVKQIWIQIKNWLKLHGLLSTIKAAAKRLLKTARGTSIQAKAKRIALASTVHAIWKVRNQRIFEDSHTAPDAVVKRIQTEVYGILYHHYPGMSGLIA